MANFSDWQDRMLRAVWRQGENLPEEVLVWMSELYDEFGDMPESEFCELWTARTFCMARAAFEVIGRSAEEETGKEVTGEEFCYIDYSRDPEQGPVGVVRIKSVEVSTPDRAEVAGAVAEGLQEFIMSHYRVVWPVCGRHGHGLHVGYARESAVWKCEGGDGGGHVVRAIDPAPPQAPGQSPSRGSGSGR
ncbi:hypothetical protein ACH49_13860 [Streptomyces leeuwenhoekii]|uniref:Uncharacterized protein n=1 Tax=Streptomyces leeuwenhoekii TaxID=1437453 RepID=A0ABR5HYW4_STRLW|nr:hypothetical protein [Streptomyces leeuwenhoekii]KMS79006.1 hypothetical protein ACH49_13860 [Streptomyces leeuwenhoekii]